MSEELERKMLISRLRAAYMVGHGRKTKRKSRKKGGELIDVFGGAARKSTKKKTTKKVSFSLPKKQNPWIQKVKKFAKDNNISYKEALISLSCNK